MKTNLRKITKAGLSVALAGATFVSSCSVFASGKVIFSDDFEIYSRITSGVITTPPEVKVYGETKIADGDFESAQDVGRYSGHAIQYGVNSIGSHNTYIYKSDLKSRSGVKSLCVDPADKDFSKNNYLSVTVKPTVDESLTFEPGIYEAEAWIYTDAPEYAVLFGSNHNSAGMLSTNGNIIGKAELKQGEWTKVTSTLSIKNSANLQMSFNQVSGWSKDSNGKYYPIYVDDLILRKVENAEIINNTDDLSGNIKKILSHQNGIAKYTTEGIRGTEDNPKNVMVSVDISNPTENDAQVTLISALYRSDGSLYSILDVTDAEYVDVYAGDNTELVNEFVVPAEAPADCYLVNYLWNSIEGLKAHTQRYVYPNHAYKIADATTYHAMKRIPNTTWMSVPYYSGYASHYYTPTWFDQVVSDVSRSGLSSLYIPMPQTYLADSTGFYSRGWVYKEVELEAGHTYNLEFYIFNNYSDGLAFRVTQGKGQLINNNPVYLSLKCTSEDFKSFQPTSGEGNDIRVYSAYPGWGKINVSFTAKETGTHCIAFTQGNNGYIEKSPSYVGGGVNIDDVTLTDITE